MLNLRERESTVISKLEAVDDQIREMTSDFLPQEQSLEKERRDIAEKEKEVAKKLVGLIGLEVVNYRSRE